MQTVAIVDYGMGNIDSVRRAIEECGRTPIVTDVPAEIERASHIVLPGVGAFPDAMRKLVDRELDKVLEEQVLGQGAPFLGICLGMQLLATTGTEGGTTAGLGWIDGEVVRFRPTDADRRIPHVGWNEVDGRHGAVLLDGIPPHGDFYFVHSYHVRCADKADAVASTPFCGGFTSVIGRDNVHAVQFHPEKSQRNGLLLLRNFLDL